jgi:SAM-dependent methyltransferase
MVVIFVGDEVLNRVGPISKRRLVTVSFHEPPNHHADYPGFSGAFGFLAGLTMVLGRGGVARLAADTARVTASDRVVDVGCGPGAAAREAARRGAEVWGVDPAAPMLRIARAITAKDLRITWSEGVAEALPVPDGAATALWSISTVHHWPDLPGGLAEAFRVLVPGGRRFPAIPFDQWGEHSTPDRCQEDR